MISSDKVAHSFPACSSSYPVQLNLNSTLLYRFTFVLSTEEVNLFFILDPQIRIENKNWAKPSNLRL